MQLVNKELSLNPSNDIDYSQFGGTPVEEAPASDQQSEQVNEEEQSVDYSQFGGTPVEPPKRKAGKFESAYLGLAEGFLGIPGMIQYGVNEYSKGIEEAFYGEETPKQSFEEENPVLAYMSTFPESEDETSRRIRLVGQVAPIAATGGVGGLVAGLIGSQAGQTVREVYGKDGKFEEFGWGEGTALAVDLATSLGVGVVTSMARAGAKTAVNRTPAIFRDAGTNFEKKVVKAAIQAEDSSLNTVISNFSQKELQGFEESAAALSKDSYTSMTTSNASKLKKTADNMYKNTQLNIISPFELTTEQSGRTLQEAANLTFGQDVLVAEREAYKAARETAEGISGQAPRALEEAKALRANMTTVEPTPDQKGVIAFLDGFISDLEATTPASTTPASKLLDASGKPITAAVEREASSEVRTRTANELIDLVQNSNQAVNYGGEMRYQSHRLKPVIATLREEVGDVLSKKQEAAKLFEEANLLHGRNAEVWGTKYMKNVRFSENPENIVGSTTKASNMRNLKQAVPDPMIQGVAERSAVENITAKGSAKSNETAINNLSPELTPQARGASKALVEVKDPLTETGGRAAVVNDVLKDAAKSVNTNKRPEKILDLMKTPKGYQIAKEALNGTPESRELFKSFERLFLEDIVSSVTDKSGVIDFSKASNILKNPEMRQVVESIGGKPLINQIKQLEKFSQNFEKNMSLYSKPEVQSLVKGAASEMKNIGIFSAILHALHIPWPVISGLGIAKAGAGISKVSYQSLRKNILSNPKAVHYLEKVSMAKTPKELRVQLPKLIAEIEKVKD